MKKRSRPDILLLAVIPILAGTVIMALAWMIVRNYEAGAFVDWQPLGTLPSEIGQFETARFDENQAGEIFITAADGKIYRGSHSLCGVDGHCWQEVETLADYQLEGRLSVSDRCQSAYPKMDSPPGDILTCAHYDDISAGSQLIRDVYFVVLEDGAVWVWQFVPGFGAAGILLVGVVGAVIAAGLVLFLMIKIYGRSPANVRQGNRIDS
jgi:hypothetical protein